MYIKAAHLNDTVRAVTGFPVTYYIQQELMRRAQPLLYQRDLSANEIVAALGFEDAQYVNRLFSKVVGVALRILRKKLHLLFRLATMRCR